MSINSKNSNSNSNKSNKSEAEENNNNNDNKDEEDDKEENDNDNDNEDEEELSPASASQLFNLDSQIKELFSELCKSMNGEGNRSIMLFGEHGSGKSALLYYTLHQLKMKYGRNAFNAIYLNGHLQTTDVEAMYAIVQQLSFQSSFDFGLEQLQLMSEEEQIEAEEDNKNSANSNTNNAKNSANNNSSNLKIGRKAQFVQNLEYLVSKLKQGMRANSSNNNSNGSSNGQPKPIFVILDEFELFATRNNSSAGASAAHSKQTLLYNLFDLINDESNNCSFNIIGLTTKNCIQSLLEKRIRSRLVHQKIFLPSADQNSFKLYFKILYHLLMIQNHIPTNDEEIISAAQKKQITGENKAYNLWICNTILENFDFKNYIHLLQKLGCSNLILFNVGLLLTTILFEPKYYLKSSESAQLMKNIKHELVTELEKNLFSNPLFLIIHDLSVHQMIVLIIACKLDTSSQCVFNFEIIHQRIDSLMRGRGQQASNMMHTMSKNVFYQCYMSLIKFQFFIKILRRNNLSVKNSMANIFHASYEMVRLNNLTGDAILEYIRQKIHHCPTWISEWLINKKTHVI